MSIIAKHFGQAEATPLAHRKMAGHIQAEDDCVCPNIGVEVIAEVYDDDEDVSVLDEDEQLSIDQVT